MVDSLGSLGFLNGMLLAGFTIHFYLKIHYAEKSYKEQRKIDNLNIDIDYLNQKINALQKIIEDFLK